MLGEREIAYDSVVEYICHYANETPDVPAVIAGGSAITYRELWRLVRGFACYLRQKAGVNRGDIVLVKASQTVEYVIEYYGVQLAGGIFAPVENTSSGESFEKIVMELSPRLIAVEPKDLESDASWKDKCISNTDICRIAEHYVDEEKKEEFVFPASEDLAVIMFTTGTTGVSKGVIHTQRSMLATVENMMYGTQLKRGTDILTPGPMNHSGPIRKMTMAGVNGSAAILLNGLKNMRAFFDALGQAKAPVGCSLVSSALSVIFSMTGDKIGEYEEKIDFIISDGEPLREINRQRLRRLLPQTRLYCNYGSTEAGSVCMYDYNLFPGKKNCIGRAGPNSPMFTVDDNGVPFKSTEERPGRLACKGSLVMQGYWNAPELTAEVMRDGMVCTNDIGYIDDEGFIYILGRQGDVINVGGLKVAPTEVEELVLAYPAVADCICVPMDDAISGKAVKLCVVLKQGASLNTKELRSFLTEHLENYKVPKRIVSIDVVPRTYNGKLDRKRAAAQFADR